MKVKALTFLSDVELLASPLNQYIRGLAESSNLMLQKLLVNDIIQCLQHCFFLKEALVILLLLDPKSR